VHHYHVSQLTEALADVDPQHRATLAAAVTELVERLHRSELPSSRRTA
jgi:hypothetical protein